MIPFLFLMNQSEITVAYVITPLSNSCALGSAFLQGSKQIHVWKCICHVDKLMSQKKLEKFWYSG